MLFNHSHVMLKLQLHQAEEPGVSDYRGFTQLYSHTGTLTKQSDVSLVILWWMMMMMMML